MRPETIKVNQGEWVTLRVLYALLAMNPSAMQIRDVSKSIDYLRYNRGINVEVAFAQISQETGDDMAYYLLGLKEPRYSFDPADAEDMDRMVHMHDENGMPTGWAK